MSSRSSPAIIFNLPSQEPQPRGSLGYVHAPIEPRSDARVGLQVDRRQSIVRRIPQLCQNLMLAQIVLKGLLVLRPTDHQPVGAREANPVAEHCVETPCNLIDEVVHVAFQATVVAAGKDNAPLVGEIDPASTVNGTP